MRSFAVNDPNRLVMPRSSSASSALDPPAASGGATVSVTGPVLLDGVGDRDLPRPDLRDDPVDLRLDRRRHGLRVAADAGAEVGDAERRRLATGERPLRELEDRRVHGEVDLLDR